MFLYFYHGTVLEEYVKKSTVYCLHDFVLEFQNFYALVEMLVVLSWDKHIKNRLILLDWHSKWNVKEMGRQLVALFCSVTLTTDRTVESRLEHTGVLF